MKKANMVLNMFSVIKDMLMIEVDHDILNLKNLVKQKRLSL